MKQNYLLSIVLFIFINAGFSQQKGVTRETVKLVDDRDLYLNGGTRAQFGGKSRTYIKFDLPPNTAEWYYSFTTTNGASGTGNLNLAIQLTAMLADPSGISSTTVSALDVPEGVATADIYLLDRDNLQPFLNKTEFSYYPEGMVQNTKQAVVKIDDIRSGTWYLGIMNPSSLNGINLNIEIVAVTEAGSLVDVNKQNPYASQKKAELYGSMGWTSFLNGDYDKCIEYSNKANNIYKWGWVYANKGLAQLMLNEESAAVETYIEAITLVKNQPNTAFVFNEMIKDIDNAKNKYPNLTGADQIKQLIQLQLR